MGTNISAMAEIRMEGFPCSGIKPTTFVTTYRLSRFTSPNPFRARGNFWARRHLGSRMLRNKYVTRIWFIRAIGAWRFTSIMNPNLKMPILLSHKIRMPISNPEVVDGFNIPGFEHIFHRQLGFICRQQVVTGFQLPRRSPPSSIHPKGVFSRRSDDPTLNHHLQNDRRPDKRGHSPFLTNLLRKYGNQAQPGQPVEDIDDQARVHRVGKPQSCGMVGTPVSQSACPISDSTSLQGCIPHMQDPKNSPGGIAQLGFRKELLV